MATRSAVRARRHSNPDPFIFGTLLANHPVLMLAIAGGLVWWARNPQQARALASGVGVQNLPAPPSWATGLAGRPASVGPGVYKPVVNPTNATPKGAVMR